SRGMANQDPLARGRVGGHLAAGGTVDTNATDMRVEREARETARFDRTAIERVIHIQAGRVVGGEEGHADMMQTRLDRLFDIDGHELAVAEEILLEAAIDLQSLVPVDLGDFPAIDEEQQLLAAHLAEGTEIAHVAEVHGKHLQRVLAVRRESVLDLEPTASAER